MTDDDGSASKRKHKLRFSGRAEVRRAVHLTTREISAVIDVLNVAIQSIDPSPDGTGEYAPGTMTKIYVLSGVVERLEERVQR